MKHTLLLLLIAIAFSSCINQDIMFKTGAKYDFDELPSVDSLEYVIAPDDRIEFRLLTNNAYELIEMSGENANPNNQQAIRQFGVTYLVEADGRARLPVLGHVKLSGLNVREAAEMLEEEYSIYYKEPFVQIAVVNNRVVVSPGDGGEAIVVPIDNNMTVIEVLARAGGIANRGNASKIKVIRDFGDHREIYNIDLSRVETMNDGYLLVQANDIIYVEPTPDLAREVLRDVTPIISLITSSLFLISFIRNQ